MKRTILFLLFVAFASFSFPQEVIEGSITSNMTLTSDKTYLLRGYVRVESGATLTIEPGTVIFGENSTQGALIIKPGGKIMAEGTADEPIVFTSEFAKAGATRAPTYGDWGGIILLGNARINVPGGTASIEGPGDSYGGTNDDDNSGVMKYVRIEYPGIAFSPNNEINGLTFGGVGRGTTIEYIQVSFSGDDSYEWFGGNVNCKYLVAFRGWDDDFDSDFGFSGNLQHLVSLRDPEIADQSSSNGFESDNDGSGSANTPLTSPTWWNVTLVGPKQTPETQINSLYRRGMHLRRNSQNKIGNALIMGWHTGILLDGSGTTTGSLNGTNYVKNSIISGTVNNDIDTASSNAGLNPLTLFTVTNSGRILESNSEIMLTNPFNFDAPNFLPLTGSPALTGAAAPPDDPFFTNYALEQEIVEGSITSNRTLTADKTYLLRGFVRVESGATLTIEPGTVIYGENSTQGSLIIKPGGKIMAEGTVNQPIIFTSEFAKAGASRAPTYGDWGGIILLGNARINVAGGTASIEGPGDSYGGTNDDDNSGVMKYVRIEYPGIAFSPNNEINGLTFGGVGRSTTIDYIQVSFSGDDSYEWFGGNVNCKHLIAYRGWDDDFDTDFGFSGNLQFLVSFRDPEIADQSSSNGFESDNDGSGSANTPLTSPTWWNVTLVGPKQTENTVINSLYRRGMHLRRNSQNKVNNALIMGWHTGILLDGSGTTSGAVAGTNFIKNSIITGTVNRDVDTASANAALNPAEFFTSNGGRIYEANFDVMLTSPFNFTSPNFIPQPGSPVLTGGGTPPNDGFFDATATYVGAFGSVDWTAGWADWTPAGYANGNFVGAFGNVDWTAGWSEWTPDGYIVVGVKDIDGSLITDYKLNQNYPNPFNPATKISYAVPNSGNVKIEVLNLLGEKITDLVNGYHNAGIYEVNFDASRLSSGIYFYRLESGSNVITKKMTLLK